MELRGGPDAAAERQRLQPTLASTYVYAARPPGALGTCTALSCHSAAWAPAYTYHVSLRNVFDTGGGQLRVWQAGPRRIDDGEGWRGRPARRRLDGAARGKHSCASGSRLRFRGIGDGVPRATQSQTEQQAHTDHSRSQQNRSYVTPAEDVDDCAYVLRRELVTLAAFSLRVMRASISILYTPCCTRYPVSETEWCPVRGVCGVTMVGVCVLCTGLFMNTLSTRVDFLISPWPYLDNLVSSHELNSVWAIDKWE